MRKNLELSEIFLRKFVKELIINENPFPMFLKYNEELEKDVAKDIALLKKPPKIVSIKKPKRKAGAGKKSKKTDEEGNVKELSGGKMMPSQFKTVEAKSGRLVQGVIKPRTIELSELKKSERAKFQNQWFQQQMPMQRGSLPKRSEFQIPYTSATLGNPDLGILNYLINDPGVDLLDCRGADQDVLVRKDGIIKRTNVTLTNNEINTIVNIFSVQTRIPIVGGVIKAALGNLIINALVSSAAGSKFILLKK